VDIFEAFVLGLVQGLTEFLPVSSSGHLVIVPWLFNWDTPGLAFDASLHLGTLIAVVVYFRTDIRRMIQAIPYGLRNLPHLVRGETASDPHSADARLGLLIVIGCIPGGVVGFLAGDRIDAFFHSEDNQDKAMLAIAFLLAAFALILMYAERVSKRNRTMSEMTLADTIFIGCAQVIALLPGTSRSGVTLSAGLFRDINRADAARYSFLLGLPLVLGAGLSGLSDLLSSGADDIGYTALFVGMATAAISGLAAISILLRFLQTSSTLVFSIYRICLAGLIVVLIATGVR
jgi:undecaprenyl-diphosphatase